MIKASLGTACVLGLKKFNMDAPPTTAYFMVGEHCVNNCSFCAQGKNSNAKEHFLSRVIWPKYSRAEVFHRLADAYGSGELKRACLQVVQGPQAFEETISVLGNIRHYSEIPVCASAQIHKPEDVGVLLDAGADKVSIALDAVTPDLFQAVKGKNFADRIKLLEECAGMYPGRISTHLIVGLGETEYDMIKMIQWLTDINVTAALFAFTPTKGTPLANRPQPPIGKYRRVQVAHRLITTGKARLRDMRFMDGRLTIIDLAEDWSKIVADENGKAFQTSGCPYCNRPYYNESPQGTIYNYPRPLTDEEVRIAIRQCELGSAVTKEVRI